MTNIIEEKKETNTSLESNGVFEVEKEDTRKWVEDTLKIEKIVISEEEIEKILKENRVTQRITLLRHYPYKEESSEDRKIIKEYNELIDKKFKWKEVDNDRLSTLSKIADTLTYKTFEEIPDEKIKQVIRNTLINKDKTIFLYSKIWKERVRITWDDLVNKFWLNNIWEVELTWSMPSDNLWDVFINMSSQFKEEYNRVKKEYQGYKEIIIIWNRTYSYGMNFISWDWDITIRESEKDFEKEWYIFHDYNKKGKILRNTWNILVTPENYEDFQKRFNIEHEGVIDFQNKLNVYLIKNPELIKRYVKSEIEELRKYCLLKLIERKELETLNEIFREEKFRKSIKLEEYEKLDKKIYNILRYYLEVYYKVLEIRNKSLDLRIKKWEDINPDFNFDKSEYNEVLEIINRGKPIKYIEWKAWAWKSFLLSHIVEKLNEENLNNNKLPKLYYPVYVNLSWKWLDEINEIWIEIYNDYEVIYLIDSIDESKIYWEERIKLDKKLIELSKKWKVILTSRSWNLINYDQDKSEEKEQKELLKNNQEIIEVQDFTIEQIDGYLQKYFLEDIKKIELTKKILLKLNWAWNNPLILCMICEVVNNWELKNESWKVINLENITMIDIYRNIVELRLIEWNSIDKNRNLESMLENSEIIDLRLGFLNKLWYEMLFWNTFTEKEDLIKIIKDMKLSWWFHKDLESLNLLFRKWENLEYDFVHQSFKEYFAAKYIFEDMKNNWKFDYKDFLLKKLENIDLNFLEMLVDFLKNCDELKYRFLLEIDKYMNYFLLNKNYKILFLLWSLDDLRKNNYLKKITIDKNIISTLIRIWGDKNLSFLREKIDDKDSDIRVSIIRELWFIWGEDNLNSIRKRINDRILNVRLQVIEELFRHWLKADINLIKSMINDSDKNIRYKVIDILGKIWWEENINLIKEMINNNSIYVKEKVIEELFKIWTYDCLLLVKKSVNDNEFKIRIKVISELLKLWWEENIKFIRETISHKDWYLREDIVYEEVWFMSLNSERQVISRINNLYIQLTIQVIEALWNIWWQANVKFIINNLDNESIDIRIKVIEVLWRIWWVKNISLIRKKINDENINVKFKVIDELWKLWWEENIKLIRKIVNDKNRILRAKAIEVLWRIWWDSNLKLIKKSINDLDSTVRINVILALWRIWWEENIRLIRSKINDNHSYLIKKVIEELWRIWWEENIRLIRENINHKYPDVRIQVIETLFKIWWEENMVIIKSMLNDDDIDVRNKAIKILLHNWLKID